jgi:hypothetical protein
LVFENVRKHRMLHIFIVRKYEVKFQLSGKIEVICKKRRLEEDVFGVRKQYSKDLKGSRK